MSDLTRIADRRVNVTRRTMVDPIVGSNVVETPDGVKLFYRDWGAGRPIVFLSGWTLNSQMWGYQMEPLAASGLRCIAYDRRGHGRSTDPGRGYDFDTLADDLDAVMQGLALKDVTLVAHSFSSGEVVRYLTRHGSGRIAHVVFVAAAAIPFLLKTDCNPRGLDPAAVDELTRAVANDFPGWAGARAEAYFAGRASPEMARATLDMMYQTSHLGLVALTRAQATTDFRQELKEMNVPTLLIHGDRDASASIDLTSRPAAALIPGARLEVYEGGPHGLYFTHKERLNSDILSFASAPECRS